MLKKKISGVNMVTGNYPSLEEIKEDFGALRLISPAYAGRDGELTAVLQYVYQSVIFSEMGKEDFARKLVEIAVNEMHHLELLATVIVKLGAPPVFTACPPYPVGYYSASCVNYTRNPRQMLCADICAEENAISSYENILCRMKNPPVAAVLSRILEEEKEHLKTFNELLMKL